jgi:putative FmdB family regulatory protein
MPLYTFKCPICLNEVEEIVSSDQIVSCPDCKCSMKKIWKSVNIGRPRFRMGAYLDNGSFVPGHFGKMAGK